MKTRFAMKRTLASVGLALILVAAASFAQPHPGRVLIGGGYPGGSTYLNGLFGVDRATGAMTTVVDTSPAPRPNYFDQLAMDLDNRKIVFASLAGSSTQLNLTSGVFRYDPKTMQDLTIARSTLAFDAIAGMEMDQDGAWLVTSKTKDAQNQTGYAVFRITTSPTTTVLTTVLTTVQLGHAQTFVDDAVRDVDTGDLLIPGSKTVGSAIRPVYSLAHDGTVTTFHASRNGPNPAYGVVQEVATGDLLNMSGSALYRTARGSNPRTVKLVSGLSPLRVNTMVFDNQSQKNPQLIGYGYLPSTTVTRASLVHIDPLTGAVTKTQDFFTANSLVKFPFPFKEALNEGNRYVQAEKTGNQQWNLRLSFPAFPNKGYVVAASASGIRPGIPLRGRRVWLNFDPLVSLTVNNQIIGAFNPGPLVLDANGAATGRIDARFVPSTVNLPIHIVAAVLDPSAVDGIAFLTEPYPMTL